MDSFGDRQVYTGESAVRMARWLDVQTEIAWHRHSYDVRAGLVGGPRLGDAVPRLRWDPTTQSFVRDRGLDRIGVLEAAGLGFGRGPFAGMSMPGGAKLLPAAGHLATPAPFSTAKSAKGGLIYEVVRNTSASAVTPTQQGEFLVGMWLEGGGANGAGTLSFLYDGVHSSHFPIGASGLDATGAIGPVVVGFYPTNYGPIGQNIPAATQTYNGGLAAVRFLLSNRPNKAPPISDFTAVAVTGTESGTGGTSKTYSIPGPLGKPTALLALASIASGTATGVPTSEIDLPAIGNYAAHTIPAQLARGQEPTGLGSGYVFSPVPDLDPAASFALTHKANGLGAATTVQILGVLRYIWK